MALEMGFEDSYFIGFKQIEDQTIMKTSMEWWEEIKNDEPKLIEWLQRQCYGEYRAYERISEIAKKFNNSLLSQIALDERNHHEWIKKYLLDRNIPLLDTHTERYWKEVNLKFDSIEEVGAVGYHAETMRLERIKIIAKDTTYPELALIFKAILPEEVYHAKVFKSLSTEEEIEIAKIDHEQGMIELGLIA